ncbi:MAG: type II toxin-antitoxin system HicB family antitoxin [Betaproteobacteria bacterium]|nr:type II toxin-antitoxin system HicB family antitoxin [Betaproteobacteria bacterium]MCL2886161.1 type II toxin-antitoxin system HicB family antitoxin [Betaproteobacteria bacterium]
MRNLDDYPFEIRPLTLDEGGGFLISYPDFNKCMSDGETVEEAIANGRDALAGAIEALEHFGHPVPAPNSGGVASGKFLTRVPKSLHAALSARAKTEGVSLNTLVLTFIAEGIGQAKQDTQALAR